MNHSAGQGLVRELGHIAKTVIAVDTFVLRCAYCGKRIQEGYARPRRFCNGHASAFARGSTYTGRQNRKAAR